MNKNDLKPGTKVIATVDNFDEYSSNEIIKYVHDEYGDNTLIGTVLDKAAKADHVFVSWDESNDEFGNSIQHDFGEEEMDVNLLTLASDLDSIESEFKNYQKQIKKKLKEAAKLVNEAGELAEKAHARSLESMWEATSPLVSAMDANGWNSSSWGC